MGGTQHGGCSPSLMFCSSQALLYVSFAPVSLWLHMSARHAVIDFNWEFLEFIFGWALSEESWRKAFLSSTDLGLPLLTFPFVPDTSSIVPWRHQCLPAMYSNNVCQQCCLSATMSSIVSRRHQCLQAVLLFMPLLLIWDLAHCHSVWLRWCLGDLLHGSCPPHGIRSSAVDSLSCGSCWQKVDNIDVPLHQRSLSVAINHAWHHHHDHHHLLISSPHPRSCMRINCPLGCRKPGTGWRGSFVLPHGPSCSRPGVLLLSVVYWLGIPLHNDHYPSLDCCGFADLYGECHMYMGCTLMR